MSCFLSDLVYYDAASNDIFDVSNEAIIVHRGFLLLSSSRVYGNSQIGLCLYPAKMELSRAYWCLKRSCISGLAVRCMMKNKNTFFAVHGVHTTLWSHWLEIELHVPVVENRWWCRLHSEEAGCTSDRDSVANTCLQHSLCRRVV